MKTAGLAHVVSSTAAREELHRRYTLLAIASLIVLGTGPVYGHHLPLNVDRLLNGVDHLGALCLTALHLLFAPVHRLFHLIIIGGLLYALWDRTRAWHSTRTALGPLDMRSPTPGDPFWRAASAVGLDPARVRIVAGLPNPAFTVGLLQPCVYVAESLAARLAQGELAAILAHERAHVQRRDPLRLSCLRALACTLFWIPALRRLAEDAADEAEVLADDAAADGQPLVLASAILKVAQWPTSEQRSTVTVGFHQQDLLERRIRRLAGEETRTGSHVTRRSLFAAVVALALVWTSGTLMAHPLPSASSAEHRHHCDHRNEPAIAHLFCLGSIVAPAPALCPHEHGA